jgi:hypothetical protein
MKQIIILNGPPRCGKDTLAKYLCKKYPFFYHYKFANELKVIAHRLYNTPEQAPDAYEKFKDRPMTEFLNLTPRQAYINLSEDYIKKHHGKEFFGLQLIASIKKVPDNNENVFVISDGGFAEELLPLVENFKPQMLTILHIHRQGCNFDNDSRHYISEDRFGKFGIKFLSVDNNGTEEEFLTTCEEKLGKTIPRLYDELAVLSALLC